MFPVNEVHNITETAHHAVTSGRDFLCCLIHKVVWIVANLFCFPFFLLTETITEPSHHKTWFESQCFILPYAWYCMAVDTDTAIRIGFTTFCVEFILPEASTEYGCFARFACTDTDCAELTVTTADNNRSTFCQTGFRSSLCSYFS